MPLYYFHLHNDVDAIDEQGTELPDLEAARAYARDEARHMSAVSIEDTGRVKLDHHIDVADKSGAVLFTVRFGDVVRFEN